MEHEGMCAKCRKRPGCKIPCAFAEAILSDDNKTPFHERNDRGLDGMPIKVLKSKNHRHEINETNLQQYEGNLGDDDGTPKSQSNPFTTEADNPFEGFSPQLSQTSVFINRFFLGRSYEDIASELEVSVETVRSMFVHAKERLLKALEFADDRNQTAQRFKTMQARNGAKFGALPKGQRWFLMHSIFRLAVPEIAELEGATAHRVNHAIVDCTDRLKAGLTTFLEPTPEEVAAAQGRIDRRRARDRK